MSVALGWQVEPSHVIVLAPRTCTARSFIISQLHGAWHILFLEEILSLVGANFGANVPALGEVVTARPCHVCFLPSILVLALDGDAWVGPSNVRSVVVERTWGEGVCVHTPRSDLLAMLILGPSCLPEIS